MQFSLYVSFYTHGLHKMINGGLLSIHPAKTKAVSSYHASQMPETRASQTCLGCNSLGIFGICPRATPDPAFDARRPGRHANLR